MHICVFSLKGISPNCSNWGGVNTHTKKLVSVILNENHEITLVTSNGKKKKDRSLTILPIRTNLNGRVNRQWFKYAQKAFIELHKSKPVDCVFSEGGAVRGFVKLLNNHKIPVVIFTHTLSIHYFYNKWQEVDGWRSFKSYIFRTLPKILFDIVFCENIYLRKYQKIVTGSSTYAKHMIKYYRLPKNKIKIINNWVDPYEFKFNEKERYKFRKQQGIKDDEIVYLLVGSFWKPKGFRVALDSYRSLLENIPKSYLYIAGEGPDRFYFEKTLRCNARLSKHVKLLGLYPHDKLPALYSAADIFVIPSLINEVLPYTLIEAMACELPIIATDIAANREALGNSACFIPRKDSKSLARAMLAFARNLPKKKADAINYRRRVIRLFSQDMASKKLTSLLNQIV